MSTLPSRISEVATLSQGLIEAATSGTRQPPFHSGHLDSAATERLRASVTIELSCGIEHLINDRRLAFADVGDLIYPSSVREAVSLWSKGWTANVQALELHNKLINHECAELAVNQHCLVTASIYLSQQRGTSFSFHTDGWDALIVQVVGEKTFHLPESKCPTIDLVPTSWLFLHSRQKHRASTNAPSIHVSFNFHRQVSLSELIG
jgi:hypothetical protein